MSVAPDSRTGVDPERVKARIAAARGARARADTRLSGAVADLALPDDARLDERTRVMLLAMLTSLVDELATDIRRHAARILAGQGDVAGAEALLAATPMAAARLARSGLIRDRGLLDELIARVRSDLIADALPVAVGAPDQPGLLIRLSEVDDTVVAAAARALLAVENRRRAASEAGSASAAELPADIFQPLVWWTAAAVREGCGEEDAGRDRAIEDAAARSLAAHDEGDRVETVAVRLARAIDARAEEVGPLLLEALGDRRLALFSAVLSRAIGIDADAARAVVLEPEGDRLWLALRAATLDRPTIARIALSLADADPRRDIEAFADDLDAIVAVAPDEARSALASLTLGADFRGAIDALLRGRGA